MVPYAIHFLVNVLLTGETAHREFKNKTTTISSPPALFSCPLLKLPGEIRNEIYAYLLATPPRYTSQQGRPHQTQLRTCLLATCQQIHFEAGAMLYAQPYTFTLALPKDSGPGKCVLGTRHEQPMGILFDCTIQPTTLAGLKEVTLQVQYALAEAGKMVDKLHSPDAVEQQLSYFCEVLRETMENIRGILNEGQRIEKLHVELQQMNPAPGESLNVACVAGAFNGIMAALRPLVALDCSCDVSVAGAMGIGRWFTSCRKAWVDRG